MNDEQRDKHVSPRPDGRARVTRTQGAYCLCALIAVFASMVAATGSLPRLWFALTGVVIVVSLVRSVLAWWADQQA